MNAFTLVQKLWNHCNMLRDESPLDSDKLPAPELIAAEIVEDLQAALDQLKELAANLSREPQA